MKLYSKREWRAFAAEVIKLHREQCSHCLSSRKDGVILQVHHIHYIDGRKPWEYSYEECTVLCKGCHAKEHGIIMPTDGWAFIGKDDLGDLCGQCDNCDTKLRYTHLITHPNWGSMEVGIDCCDHLTKTTEASDLHRYYINRLNRRKIFVNSSRWIRFKDGANSINHKDIFLMIKRTEEGKFRISLNNVNGKKDYETFLDAQIKAFDFIEDGSASVYLNDRQRKIRARRQPDGAAAACEFLIRPRRTIHHSIHR